MTDSEDTPLVSIGMPVFNEDRFIDSALRSLRAQDYPHLEIIVSDNASTDRTVEICEHHAAEDPRIRIVRAACNRGVTPNFQRVLDLASGRYFMWAAGHDLWTPNLVSECVAQLETNAGACLAFASCRWIEPNDMPYPRASGWTDTRGLGPIARLITVFWGNMHPVVGLIRTDALHAGPALSNFVGGDLLLLSELALRGDFVHATRATWSRREFRVETVHDDKLRRYASTETGITKSAFWKFFPLLRLPVALLSVAWRSHLPVLEKFALLVVLLVSFPLRYLVGKRGQ